VLKKVGVVVVCVCGPKQGVVLVRLVLARPEAGAIALAVLCFVGVRSRSCVEFSFYLLVFSLDLVRDGTVKR
jgi:hypothetical protein